MDMTSTATKLDERIAVLSGHLTQVNKNHIKAILRAGLNGGKINRISYELTHEGLGTYSVAVSQMDRGLISCGGSKLRMSTYTSTFTADTPDRWRSANA